MTRSTIVNDLMNEVVMHGGIPMRRCDVYKDTLRITGDRRAADYFAFNPNREAVNLEPATLDECEREDFSRIVYWDGKQMRFKEVNNA